MRHSPPSTDHARAATGTAAAIPKRSPRAPRILAALRLTAAPRLAAAAVGLAAAAGLASASRAHASVATPLGGEFSISPARRYVVATPPAQLAPTRVANTTAAALRVTVIPVLLTQLPSGAFAFDLAPPDLRTARSVLDVEPRHFTLAAGGAQMVGLRWRRLPAHARTVSAGVIYQATPASNATAVQVVERLLGVNILRLPGHYRRTGRLLALHVSQARPHVLRVALDARNTGQAVTGPGRIAVTIHDAAGARLLSTEIRPDIVLPGATREFALELRRRLPAGAYTAIGHMTFGSSHQLVASAHFLVVGDNQLPAAAVRIGPLFAQGAIGGSAEVTAALANAGAATGAAALTLDLYRLTNGLPGPRPIATRRLRTPALKPGQRSELRDGVGHLRAGEYRLIASYTDATGTPRTLLADFQARTPLDLLGELRRFSKEHALLIPGALLLALGALLTGAIAHARRLRAALAGARSEALEPRPR